ncbi:MAG TPA: antibiotic biosynthesis monooxygenase [Gammaproteobacteria bacterium]
MIADTPAPPYYAVIFTSQRSDETEGYEAMAERMVALARQQPGFLGMETAHTEIGLTISYWESLQAIQEWKADLEHRDAQRLGREKWYAHYRVRITRVEREYGK